MDFAKIERIRQMATMSQQLAKKDPEFCRYAGADFQLAKQIVIIDLALETKLFKNERLILWMKFYRLYLEKLRKAYFASEGSNEITKLGLLLGWQDISVRATK